MNGHYLLKNHLKKNLSQMINLSEVILLSRILIIIIMKKLLKLLKKKRNQQLIKKWKMNSN